MTGMKDHNECQATRTRMAPVVIGVDGGSTKTTCAVLDLKTRSLLAQNYSGGCNRNSISAPEAMKNLFVSLEGAIRSARVEWESVQAICLGISGVDSMEDVHDHRASIQMHLKSCPIRHDVSIFVSNDAVTALSAGTCGEPTGLVLIAGTGSIGYGSVMGTHARAAGWGASFRDGGSGYDLGQMGLQAAAESIDGRGKQSVLSHAFAHHLQLQSMHHVMKWIYEDQAWSRTASLAPVVIEAAAGGDEVATCILERGAMDLVATVEAVLSRLQPLPELPPLPIILAGGLMLGDNAYSRIVKRYLTSALPGHALCRPQVDAATGAALLAAHYLDAGIHDTHAHVLHGVMMNNNDSSLPVTPDSTECRHHLPAVNTPQRDADLPPSASQHIPR